MSKLKAIHYSTGERLEIDCRDGKFTKLTTIQRSNNETLPYIAPGLIDLQINGYKGVDFNTLPLKESDILKITRELWKEGVTSYFPTIITNSPEKIEEAMETIKQVCTRFPYMDDSIAGVHLEGPFISPEDGPRGAHDAKFVSPPDWSLVSKWQKASGGRLKLLTISPEWDDSEVFIKTCTENGIIVSIGHTSATPAQIRAAISAGAKLSTHLGNGAHLMLPRHPNYIWEQLANDGLAATFIADGFHLPDAVLKTIIRMKGKRAIVVSDSVSLGGMEPGEYNMHIGGKVVLTKKGKLHMASNPDLLAGSAQSQIWGINHLLKQGLCELADVIDMATVNPAEWLRLSGYKLEVDSYADFILFNYTKSSGIELLETYKRGKCVSIKNQSGVEK
ncbi:N-acetylglucosamine-6-phosphate deacetylase [Pseudalkalibacillus salsuginis]|uniref:N-acetylglucosamine-6-phosphate deacetylase n=1 Tax=Pseudalkalibacillus salsuginis TaxID=2910972 RepID=UPI001F34AEAB|nr:amidohydrolase family protein [Pseudalkalibacillus salsuginis]MCF6411603.1 amidohydrolase family protein [Pseudalkalibacillus salsuginis]